MAHSLSAKKRVRQNERRRILNRAAKTLLRGKLRKLGEALARGAADQAATAFTVAAQTLDREAARGLVHKNAAARRKSRLARRLNALKAKAAPAS